MARTDGVERRLYRDLSGLLEGLRSGPFADLERAIEDRFRRYLGDAQRSPDDTLSVTLSWQLPEGADSWALYGTEFRLEARGCHAGDHGTADANAGETNANVKGNVVAFPTPHRERAGRSRP